MSDLISRQAAIDATWFEPSYTDPLNVLTEVRDRIKALPSVQPEITRCRNCKFASGDSRICIKFGHSPIGELDFCAWAERRIDDH